MTGRATSYRLFLAVDWDPSHGINAIFSAWPTVGEALEEANLRADSTPDVVEIEVKGAHGAG